MLRVVTPAEFGASAGEIARIEGAATAAAGHPHLNDAVWRDLRAPGPGSAGFLAPGVAYAHVARSDNFSPEHWAIGLVAAPGTGAAVPRALLDAATAHVAAHGGGRAVCWVLGAHDTSDASDATAAPGEDALAGAGFVPGRAIYEMRVGLPVAATAPVPPGVALRAFAPGRDEAAWLAVNNRAFANHPEQGDWIEATLRRRMDEDWFDPSVFLLAEDADGLAGFNWMKIHGDPPVGEIFVIGVDPRAQGTGLGVALALAGLDAAYRRGVRTGSLFCDADNTRALRLYASLGFTVHRCDRAWEREVTA